MFAIIKRYKKTSIVVFIALSVWHVSGISTNYHFHTPQEVNTWGKYPRLAEVLTNCI